ncbi:hypothetical protein IPG41_05980 [Candidatus Peregrinibacteria bacterium]|nr:MAG: hypothetical protein IPG41_05980 [Candidatus Peregrinibacteria bacterium]
MNARIELVIPGTNFLERCTELRELAKIMDEVRQKLRENGLTVTEEDDLVEENISFIIATWRAQALPLLGKIGETEQARKLEAALNRVRTKLLTQAHL